MTETDKQKKVECYHCGEFCPDVPISHDGYPFCCDGCKAVYEILKSNNLCNYYEIEKTPGINRRGKRGSERFAFLDDSAIIARLLDFNSATVAKVTFFIPAMHCSSCIWLLENLFKLNSAINSSRTNFLSKRVTISYNPAAISLRQVVELLAQIGYEPDLRYEDITGQKPVSQNKSVYIKLGVAGFAFGNIMLLSFPEYLAGDTQSVELQLVFTWFILALSLPVFFYSASEYLVSAWRGLRKKIVNIDVPLALGIIAFYLQSLYSIFSTGSPGYMDSFAGLIFLLLIGKLFQNKTYDLLNFERHYRSYFPVSVTIKKAGHETTVPLSEVKPGMRIIVRNDELIPADGVVISGDARIDYSFVTGEALPIIVREGDVAYAGGKQAGTFIELEVIKEVAQSYLTQLWNDASFAKDTSDRYTELSNTVSKYFTAVILLLAVGGAAFWLFVDPSKALITFSAVLIIACPCALAMSTPFTFGNALRLLGRNHFYLKNIRVLESLSNADTVVFDKTGTITATGIGGIKYNGSPLSEKQRGMLLSLVKNSTHPLSRRVTLWLAGAPEFSISRFSEIPGKGLTAEIAGAEVKVGSAAFLAENSHALDADNPAVTLVSPAETRMLVAFDGEIAGYFSFANEYRPGIAKALAALARSYKMFLLSGDNEGERQNLAGVFPGSGNLFFNHSPFDKLAFIKELSANGAKTIMLGDGLNDAGALRAAETGIAVSEDVINFTPASDAILKASELIRLPRFLAFINNAVTVVKISFFISFVYNVFGLYVALRGELSPLFAAVLMPLSSITVIGFTTLTTNFIAYRKGLWR